MQPRDLQPLIEAFLVIDQPRQRLSHWTAALGPLDDGRAPPLAMVSAYYDPMTDQALIGLHYDELALGTEHLLFVIELALLAEIGMIQPRELTEADRKRFLGERLARCSVRVDDQRSVVGTLTELVRKLREQKAGASRPPPLPEIPAPKITAARGLPTRGDTDDPHLLVHAKGTRDRLAQPASPQPAGPRSTRDVLRTQNDLVEVIDAPAAHARVAVRATSSNVIPRVHRAETVEVAPIEVHRMATASVGTAQPAVITRGPVPPPPPAGRARTPSQVGTEPYLPSPSSAQPQGIIYARYLRSGRWVPLRIGALSLKGAALMAGALPRLADHVDIALAFGNHRALVRGSVAKVSTAQEMQLSGAATFSVGFQLDDASKRQLTDLLTAARAANVMIKPPPARNARRYPVDWPVCLGTPRGAVRGDALDVSVDGMFVKPQHALAPEAPLGFSAVLDDGEGPVSGRAKVVRHVSDAEARSCGLAPGFGLQIVDMGDLDRTRWLAFVARVDKRADRRVLIGAAPARLSELQACLAAAGYAVTGGTDPGALVQLASAGARPVDAALIDAQWLTGGMTASWVESLFSARNVPCVTLHGDARRARATVDRLLGVDGSSQRG